MRTYVSIISWGLVLLSSLWLVPQRAAAEPVDPVEALDMYVRSGFAFPSAPTERGAFYASTFMQHSADAVCPKDSNCDGIPDSYGPCALDRDWNCGTRVDGGVDTTYVGSQGATVSAADAGWVVSTVDGFGSGGGSAEGNQVILRHPGPDGVGWTGDDVFTVYGQLEGESLLVQPGTTEADSEFVYCGQPIARVGDSGAASGPGLMFEVRVGSATGAVVDPYLPTSPPPYPCTAAVTTPLNPTTVSLWHAQGYYPAAVYQPFGQVPGARDDCIVEVVDDDDLGFSSSFYDASAAAWTPGLGPLTDEASGGFGDGMSVPPGGPGGGGGGGAGAGHYFMVSPSDTAVAPVRARWTPSITRTGLYEVHVFVPGTGGGAGPLAQAAFYSISYHGGRALTTVDQMAHQNSWQRLVFPGDLSAVKLVAGTTGRLTVINSTGELPAQTIGIDAARFVYAGPAGSVGLGGSCGHSNECASTGVCFEGQCVAPCWNDGCGATEFCEIASGVCIPEELIEDPADVMPSDDHDGDGLSDSVEGDGDPDGDGVPNYLDSDSDGDGISDAAEGTTDPDGDEIPSFLDDDSDGDGISDADEGAIDWDADLVPSYLDDDSDGDGVPDIEEGADDPDGDGLANWADPDSDDDGLEDGLEGLGDSDGDGLADYVDTDADDDGVADADEGDDDPDGDGTPNYLDDDSDGDGVSDSIEGQGDPDLDGVPSFLDDDSDGDGIPDADEGGDDPDGDGVPSSLDDDSDGDGLSDADEGSDDPDGDGVPSFLDDDSDGDGIPDADEGGVDPDGDGVPSFLDDDSDGDGIPDVDEGGDDPDGDGVPNFMDEDSDGDGIPDADEGGGDPDGDGVPNFMDEDSDGDGLPDADEGLADPDGDGVPNALDTDSDGDGQLDGTDASPYDVVGSVGDDDDDTAFDPGGSGGLADWGCDGCSAQGQGTPTSAALLLGIAGLLGRRRR